MRDFNNCSTEQHEQLLNWFFYRITPEQRESLRADLPNAYDAFTGKTVAHGSLTWARLERQRLLAAPLFAAES